MNKKLVLCVVLALSLILVGTGYAYWTDTLNVTTKATTGDFDVTFVDLGAYAQYENEYGTDSAENSWSIIDGIGSGFVPANFFERGTNTYNDVFGKPDKRGEYYDRAEGFNSIEMDAELKDPGRKLKDDYPGLPYGNGHIYGDTIRIELKNMYPGYAQAFRSDIINIGSIAAKLSSLKFNLEKSNDKIAKLIGVALLVQDENPNTYGNIVKLAANFDENDIFTLGNVKFVRLSALLKGTVEIKEPHYILAPYEGSEHRGDLFIGIAVDPDADGVYTTGTAAVRNTRNNDSWTENKSVTLDIEFGWDQFNQGVDVPENVTNILEKQN